MSSTNIVVVGGGTGNHTTLSGLRGRDCNLAAVVAMTDSGGSSGRLRDEMGHLPPGDLRQCLIALASSDHSGEIMKKLLDTHFDFGFTPTILIAVRSKLLVEMMEPATKPSASP